MRTAQPLDQAILALAEELGGIGLAADQALDAAVALKKGPGVASLADLSILKREHMDQLSTCLPFVVANKLMKAWEQVQTVFSTHTAIWKPNLDFRD